VKAFLGFLLASFAVITLAAADHARAAAATGLPAATPQEQTLYCASDDMRRHECPADTRGGVQLTRQRSEADCVFNRTWGYTDRGIWVDRGCRADFQLGARNWAGWGRSYTIYCASDDMDRDFCPTDTHHGVRLVRQRSDADCIYGRTWGYNRRGIWVDRGCRADFDIGSAGWSGDHDTQTIYCASDDMGPHRCPIDTSRGVQLIRQRSDADCIYGVTWGYNSRGIWVDRGCRADFQIGGDRDDDWDDHDSGDVQTIYCASDDMDRQRCFADTRFGVRLIRQRSEARCEYGRTWGYDDRGIWVDRGCRADFQVGGGDWDSGNRPTEAGRPGGRTVSIYCASDDERRHRCQADTRFGVRLVRQRSGSPCDYGRTWGYDDRGIWVDRGCRADFEVTQPR
jgi:hypothetical protein